MANKYSRICKAHKSNGDPCGQVAAKGQEVCRYHGGNAPQAKAAAVKRLARAEVLSRMERMGVPREVDSNQALIEQLREAAGNVEFLRAEVRELNALVSKDHLGDEVITAQVKLYNEERDRLRAAARDCIAAGILERQVQLEEDRGRLLAEAIRKIFDDPELALTIEQKRVARVAASKHLRVIAGTAA